MKRRLLALLALLAGFCFAGVLFADAASAHATVVASNPADGAKLKTAPAEVTITFDEQVGLGDVGYLHVVDQTGHRVDTGSSFHPDGDGTTVEAQLKTGLGPGTYTESYRVISADSHPVAGTVEFVVGNAALVVTTTKPASTVNHLTSVIFDVIRWISYAGFAILGGAWLPLTSWPAGRLDRRARRIGWTGWWLTALGAISELLIQGPYAAGKGITAVTDHNLLIGTLHTHYGDYAIARLLLLVVLVPVLIRAHHPAIGAVKLERAYWPILVGLAYTFSAVGHPSTTNPAWVSIPADMLHLLGMAAWIGGLIMLVVAVLPRREPAELLAVLPVFSRVAFASVVVLAITGGYEAWRGIGTIDAIFTTSYGLLVVTKVALFGGLLALGNLSRLAIQRDVAGTAARPLRVRRAVLAEVVLAIGVLIATSVLVAEPRGKEAISARDARPISKVAALGGGRTVTVTVDPGKHGTVTTSVVLSRGTQPESVSATAALPAQQLGPISLPLVTGGSNRYGASGVVLPAAGDWVVTIVVTLSEFDAVTTDVHLHLH